MRESSFICMLGLASLLAGQNNGSSGLVLRVNPEAHLTPSSAQLAFHVARPGDTAISSPVTVNAWVRALPGQQILLTAHVRKLTGPVGDVPFAALQWSGQMLSAKGGGQAANCLGGGFSSGPDQPVIGGWNESGIATCSMRFSLTTNSTWLQGDYAGQVDLQLSTR